MFSYIIRRCIYSVLVVIGVLILTFLLFRTAAGDPAAALLGKNPSPREVEELRSELGTDRPVIFGYWRNTEVFTSINFSSRKLLPGVKLLFEPTWTTDGLRIKTTDRIEFVRNFNLRGTKVELAFFSRGSIAINGSIFDSSECRELRLPIPDNEEKIIISGGENTEIYNVKFFRKQKSPLDSQLTAALFEICQPFEGFPYIQFFNFGKTLMTRESIREILYRGVVPSLSLMVPIFTGELLLGIILALLCTAFKGQWIDRLIVLSAIAGMSVSYLVFIIFGQWYLGYYYNLFPVWGWGQPCHLALPVIIGIASGLGGGVRFYRTVFVNELNKEYLRTATAKGCSQFAIYGQHLLRNAAIPIITRASAALPFLFTGSLLLETFFGIPGLGYAGIEALNNSDLQLLKALVIVSAMLFVIINLISDIAYAWADPRVRLSK